jgi:hypothetical protein
MMDINCPLECVSVSCPEPDFLEKHNGFIITLVGSLSAVLGVIFTYCIKSRCRNIKTCCISCDRDVINIKKENIELNNIA